VDWKLVAIGGALLGGIGLLIFAGRSSSSKPTPKRVALIGDSYAVGLGPELAKLIPGFKFAGVERTNTSQWANHAAACGACGDWLTAFKPDIVLVSLGVNDGATPNTANYQRIVQGLQKIGARVVWIEPPADVNAPATREAIASLGVPTVPATTAPLASDGLHPRNYGPWAQEIARSLS
jgi:lysophospholipase L1-like esterase